MISYSITELAGELVTTLQGKTSVSDARNGLFLAAQLPHDDLSARRSEPRPESGRRGSRVRRLWADAARDPDVLIPN